MRRLTDDLVLSLKDGIRTVRYSLRSEAETPGSALPEAYRHVDLGPLGTVGAMIGTPVIRMADGLFSQVETVTLGILDHPGDRQPIVFPRPVDDYFARGSSEPKAPFTRVFYHETKALLQRYGARQALVSEHAIEDLRTQTLARHGDLVWSAVGRKGRRTGDADAALVQVCAALAAGFARIRPIQKLDGIETAAAKHLLLAPNLYCGMVLGLATAIATVRRQAADVDGTDIIESADAVVDARFDRLKAATQGKDPVTVLAREFETVLPFLP